MEDLDIAQQIDNTLKSLNKAEKDLNSTIMNIYLLLGSQVLFITVIVFIIIRTR
jgi:hypothetical protein